MGLPVFGSFWVIEFRFDLPCDAWGFKEEKADFGSC